MILRQRNHQVALFFCNFADINFYIKNLSSTNEKANDQRSPKGLQESITS
jgi:hypothetical protein